MVRVFAPGCALMATRPRLALRVSELLVEFDLIDGVLQRCCHVEPGLPQGSVVINTCPGCDRRYRGRYEGITTRSLWEVLAERSLPWPDHGGIEMAIQDACPTRKRPLVHDAVRRLLGRMQITVVEPEATRGKAICCGDRFQEALPEERVRGLMARRAAAMPREDVVVYCVSCVKAMAVGGRRPRHLLDLLFGEPTPLGTTAPDAWHAELDSFIAGAGRRQALGAYDGNAHACAAREVS